VKPDGTEEEYFVWKDKAPQVIVKAGESWTSKLEAAPILARQPPGVYRVYWKILDAGDKAEEHSIKSNELRFIVPDKQEKK
jgi:hypothetical protein